MFRCVIFMYQKHFITLSNVFIKKFKSKTLSMKQVICRKFHNLSLIQTAAYLKVSVR